MAPFIAKIPEAHTHKYSSMARKSFLIAIALWLWAISTTALAQQGASATGRELKVLVLTLIDPEAPVSQLLSRSFKDTIEATWPGPVTVFTEAFNAPSFVPHEMAPEWAALLSKKYANKQIDLVVGVSGEVASFVDQYHRAIWPTAAVMFTAVLESSIRSDTAVSHFPYVAWKPDVRGTLDIIQRLQPEAKRLIVIGGVTPLDGMLMDMVKTALAGNQRWTLEVWNQYSAEQLRQKAARLPKDTAVLFTTVFKDAAGGSGYSRDVLERIAETSTAPLYGMFGQYKGHRMTAGSLIDFQDVGRLSADLALKLLDSKPHSLQKMQLTINPYCFADEKRMDSQGLSTRNLPPNCDIQNPLRNLWTDYKGLVIAAAVLIALQALTIAAMLWQRRRRHSAERESNANRLELRRAMRFASMGELTASIAHEINQPLGAILSNTDAAEMLLNNGRAKPEELKAILADIRRDDQRAHAVVSRIRSLLTKAESPRSAVHLHASIQDVMALLLPEAKRRSVSLALSLDAHNDLVSGDSVQFQQVLLNLVMNAMDALDDKQPQTRRIHIKTTSAYDHITMSVADNGCGIDEATQATIFDSLFTTKQAGLGMGLSIVRAIVDAHGGTVEVQSSPGDGAVFSVRLPVIKEKL